MFLIFLGDLSSLSLLVVLAYQNIFSYFFHLANNAIFQISKFYNFPHNYSVCIKIYFTDIFCNTVSILLVFYQNIISRQFQEKLFQFCFYSIINWVLETAIVKCWKIFLKMKMVLLKTSGEGLPPNNELYFSPLFFVNNISNLRGIHI